MSVGEDEIRLGISSVRLGLGVGDLEVGQQAAWSKTISEADIYTFAGVSGDINPLHINAVYAATTRFGQRLVHGMLVASMLSTVQANELPGPGTLYIRQTLEFCAPVYFGDTVTAVAQVASIDHGRNRVVMTTRCFNQDGLLVIDGESELSPPRSRLYRSKESET